MKKIIDAMLDLLWDLINKKGARKKDTSNKEFKLIRVLLWDPCHDSIKLILSIINSPADPGERCTDVADENISFSRSFSFSLLLVSFSFGVVLPENQTKNH